MEKIKSVLSGHGSKDGNETAHDTHATSSTGAHTEGQTHPIYDEMTGQKGEFTSTSHPTTAGTTTSAGQTGISSGLGKTEQTGTGNHGLVSGSDRPGASTLGAGNASDAFSQASIKSGVIGFGGQEGGHAALPARNSAEDNLQRNQIVGGGDATTTTPAQSGVASQAAPHSDTITRDQTAPSTGALAAPTSTTQTSTAQPYDKTLRQESYTADTDRSFPLAGGVASKHGTDTAGATRHPETAATSSAAPYGTASGVPSTTQHPVTSEREPGTKEKDVGVRDGHGREGLAAAAGAAAIAAPLAHSGHKKDEERGLEGHQAAHGNQSMGAPITSTTGNTTSSGNQGPNPEALAAARAAAAKSSDPEHTGPAGITTGSTSSRPTGQRSESRPHIPGEFPSPTPDESKTFLYYRNDLVPEPGAESRLTPGHHGAHDQTLAPATGAAAAISTVGPHGSDALNKADPRVDSDRDGSTTIGSTTGAPTGQHELRHTGTLDEPQSKSSEHEDHTGRNAALAGGLAGAAGLGYAASQKHDHSNVASDTTSPYSSKALDPRVSGGQGIMDQQRFDPQAKSTEPTTHHALQTSNPAGITSTGTTSTTGTTSIPAEKRDNEHHYGRDAAILGGGAATAAGAHHALKRDEPAGTSNTTSTTAPTSGTTTTSGPVHDNKLLNKLDPRVKEGEATGPTGASTASSADKEKDHHYGRDAALVGGGAATAAGAHHALQRDDAQGTSSHPSTAGATSGTTTTGPVHDSKLLNKLDPRVKETTPASATGTSTDTSAAKKENDHHYGRDAALVGGGAATAAGAQHALQRNDTPGTGTTVLPQDSANPSKSAAPLSSSAAPITQTSAPLASTAPTSTAPVTSAAPTAQSSAPLSSSAAPVAKSSVPPTDSGSKNVSSYKGPLTTSGEPFYGTAGAPAPVADTKASEKDHHYGRDAALAGGAAAGAGGLAYASQHDKKAETGPASSTIGPHSSNVANVLDPRVQPDPSKQSHHQAGSTAQDPASRTIGPHDSNVANVLDPRVQPDPSKQRAVNPATEPGAGQKDHHYGRDAAIAGGAGAAGYGAYEAAKSYGDHRSTQPGASMAEQRYDTTASSAGAPNPVPTAGHYDYNNPTTSRNVNEPAVGHQDPANDHTSRNTALGGAALGGGALAGAAYAGSKHGEHTQGAPASTAQPLAGSSQPLAGSSQPLAGSHQSVSSAQPPVGSSAAVAPGTAPGTHSRYDSAQIPEDDHTKRNAALAGAGGVAAAGGAYAYSQHHDADRERLAKEEQDRLQKEQHAHDKEQKKLDKEHAKHEKEAHKHDKLVAAQAKEDKKLEKEREKEAARHEEGEPEEKKKHGILSFLHRDKTKKEKRGSGESSPRGSGDYRRSSDSPRHSKEYAAGGAALGAGAAAGAAAHHESDDPNSPRWKGKNLLHKDPPKGHPAREALENKDDIELTGGKREHMGVDGPIGRPDAISGYTETRSGVYGAQPLNEVPENNKVIEPHTGLPMNIGRYGQGEGGTDASSTVHGHHTIPGVDENLRTGHGTTNWEDIKKKDTPY